MTLSMLFFFFMSLNVLCLAVLLFIPLLRPRQNKHLMTRHELAYLLCIIVLIMLNIFGGLTFTGTFIQYEKLERTMIKQHMQKKKKRVRPKPQFIFIEDYKPVENRIVF